MSIDISSTTLYADLLEDLTSELSIDDEEFNATLLGIKIKNAIREMIAYRRYDAVGYSDEKILTDLENYYGNIRDCALYDYNKIGTDFQSSDTESSVTKIWKDRDAVVFNGVLPLARL